jgi:hypothetical protein
MKVKSSPTIKQAALQAFNSLPDTFRGNDIFRLVKIITRRPFIHTDSSIRKLHQLRTDKKINFTRIGSKDESHYKKLAVV